MDAMDDVGLFAGFEEQPEAKRLKVMPDAVYEKVELLPASPRPCAQQWALLPPPPFDAMRNEHVASVLYGEHIDAESRDRVESAFRSATVTVPMASEATVLNTNSAGPAAVGAVHYYQAFCADYAGAVSAAAAAAAPGPAYARLFELPLPHADDGKGFERRRPARRPQGFQGRYFDAPETAVAQPGVLSAELRTQLGMGPNDPPPYLTRMQALGYPPGYLGDRSAVEEEPGELHFFAGASRTANGAHGGSDARLEPLVDFPGLNVPPPEGADPRAWGWRGPILRPAHG